jgi:hypothetical protein
MELIPSEQQSSPKIPEVTSKFPQVRLEGSWPNPNYSIYCTRDIHIDFKTALEFFKSPQTMQHPVQKDIVFTTLHTTFQEPPNDLPLLIPATIYKQSGIQRGLPKRRTSLRVWSYIDLEGRTKALFSEAERLRIGQFTKEYLDIDIGRYDEHFGAKYLVASNHLIRKYEFSLSDNGSQLNTQWFMRSGKSLQGCYLSISDWRSENLCFSFTHKLEKTQEIIPIPCEPHFLELRLFDAQGRVIEYEKAPFAKSCTLSTNMIVGKRIIQAEESANLVDLISTSNFSIGDTSSADSVLFYANSERKRRWQELEQSRDFIFFDGEQTSRNKALEVVRTIIGIARDRCVFVDPYFGGKDVFDYPIYAQTINLQIRILSSVYFAHRQTENDKTEGDFLRNQIEAVTKQDGNLKIAARLFRGRDKCPVHDRLLLVDNDIYVLGSSFNEFGSRTSVLYKVPDPERIINRIESWWKSDIVVELDKWLLDRGVEE